MNKDKLSPWVLRVHITSIEVSNKGNPGELIHIRAVSPICEVITWDHV